MSTRYAEITVDPDGVAVTREAACLCLCAEYHPGKKDVCTSTAEAGAQRCAACVAADVDVEGENLDWLDYAGGEEDLGWLDYEEVGQAALTAVAA